MFSYFLYEYTLTWTPPEEASKSIYYRWSSHLSWLRSMWGSSSITLSSYWRVKGVTAQAVTEEKNSGLGVQGGGRGPPVSLKEILAEHPQCLRKVKQRPANTANQRGKMQWSCLYVLMSSNELHAGTGWLWLHRVDNLLSCVRVWEGDKPWFRGGQHFASTLTDTQPHINQERNLSDGNNSSMSLFFWRMILLFLCGINLKGKKIYY